MFELVSGIDHEPTRLATAAERALLACLEGGCQVPIGALGSWHDRTLALEAVVADLDGRTVVRETAEAVVRNEEDARALGVNVAERLLAGGAGAILERVRASGETGM